MPALDLGTRLIDTSVWIRADRKGHDALKDRLRELLVAGSVWICWPIRAELLIGVKTPERWAILRTGPNLGPDMGAGSPLGPSACQKRPKRSAA